MAPFRLTIPFLLLGCLIAATPAWASRPPSVQDPAPTQAESTTLDGVGFTATFPAKWHGWESANGHVYFLDIQETPVDSLRNMADGRISLLVTSTATVTPEQLAGERVTAGKAPFESDGFQLAESFPTTRNIGGTKRAGQAMRWDSPKEGSAAVRQEYYLWVAGDWIFAATLSGSEGEGASFAAVSEVMANLVVKDFDPQALRTVWMGRHYFQVPALTPTQILWDQQPHVAMTWVPGFIELLLMPQGYQKNGEEAAFHEMIDHEAKVALGATVPPRPIFRWHDGGIVRGTAYSTKPAGESEEIAVRVWYVPAEKEFLVIASTLKDPRYKAAMDAELARVWENLHVEGFERHLARFEGHGLSFLHDPILRLQEKSQPNGHRVQLEAYKSEATFSFTVRDGLDTSDLDATLATLLQEMVIKENPILAKPAVERMNGSFLGQEGGLSASFSRDGKERKIYLYGSPLADGKLALAELTTRAEDKQDNLLIFANLLAQTKTVTVTPQVVKLKSCHFIFRADHDWGLDLEPVSPTPYLSPSYLAPSLLHGEDTIIHITSESGVASRAHSEISGELIDADPVERLGVIANETLDWTQRVDRGDSYTIGEAFGATLPLAGSFALLRQYDRSNGPDRGRVRLYIFATAKEIIRIRVRSPVDADPALEADIQEFLASLTPTSQLDHENMKPRAVASGTGFHITLPPGYTFQRSPQADGPDLRIQTAGRDDAVLELSVVGADAAGPDIVECDGLRIRATRTGNPAALALCGPAFDAILASSAAD